MSPGKTGYAQYLDARVSSIIDGCKLINSGRLTIATVLGNFSHITVQPDDIVPGKTFQFRDSLIVGNTDAGIYLEGMELKCESPPEPGARLAFQIRIKNRDEWQDIAPLLTGEKILSMAQRETLFDVDVMTSVELKGETGKTMTEQVFQRRKGRVILPENGKTKLISESGNKELSVEWGQDGTIHVPVPGDAAGKYNGLATLAFEAE